MFTTCSSNKTVFVSNKLGKPITLSVDSTYIPIHVTAFKDSLDGKKKSKKTSHQFWKRKMEQPG